MGLHVSAQLTGLDWSLPLPFAYLIPCELVPGVEPAKNYLFFLRGLVSCKFSSLKELSAENKRGAVRTRSGQMGLCVILGLEAFVQSQPYYKIAPAISRNSGRIVMG